MGHGTHIGPENKIVYPGGFLVRQQSVNRLFGGTEYGKFAANGVVCQAVHDFAKLQVTLVTIGKLLMLALQTAHHIAHHRLNNFVITHHRPLNILAGAVAIFIDVNGQQNRRTVLGLIPPVSI